MEQRRESDRILAEHMIEEENRLTTIEGRLQQLEEKIDTLQDSIQGLVGAWQTAGHLVSFIKWLSIAIASGSVVWAFLKGYLVK